MPPKRNKPKRNPKIRPSLGGLQDYPQEKRSKLRKIKKERKQWERYDRREGPWGEKLAFTTRELYNRSWYSDPWFLQEGIRRGVATILPTGEAKWDLKGNAYGEKYMTNQGLRSLNLQQDPGRRRWLGYDPTTETSRDKYLGRDVLSEIAARGITPDDESVRRTRMKPTELAKYRSAELVSLEAALPGLELGSRRRKMVSRHASRVRRRIKKAAALVPVSRATDVHPFQASSRRKRYVSKASKNAVHTFSKMSVAQLRQQTAIKLSELRRKYPNEFLHSKGKLGGRRSTKGRELLHELGEVRHQIAVKSRGGKFSASNSRTQRDCCGYIYKI